MKAHIFSGLSVAIVTPFNPDFTIDVQAFQKQVDFLLINGVDHVVVCGTTGESPTFNDAEFDLLIRTAVEVSNGRGTIIAGSGSNDTQKTTRRSIMAEKAGAQGLLLVTPYYNKPMQRALIAHYRHVADAVNIPIMLYNVPGRTSINLLPESVLELSSHPNIVAVKEASNDMQQIMKILEIVPKDFTVLSGDDALTLPLIAAGGHGLVSVIGNEIPAQTKKYVTACLDGDFEKAREWHYKLQPLMRFNFIESNPAPVKAALHLMGRMNNVLRLPLLPLDKKYEADLRTYLTQLGAL